MARQSRGGRLPLPDVGPKVVLVDAVRTRDGWLAFALTHRGLRATRSSRRTRGRALRGLGDERRLRGYVLEAAPKTVAGPWGRWLKDAAGGKAVDLTRIPVDERGWSDFQRKVYRRVRRIPRGEVATYAAVARAASSAGAARAVGQMMAHNPIAPIVPCHRVVGSDGSLCGFSAEGGTALKAKMIARERRR